MSMSERQLANAQTPHDGTAVRCPSTEVAS